MPGVRLSLTASDLGAPLISPGDDEFHSKSGGFHSKSGGFHSKSGGFHRNDWTAVGGSWPLYVPTRGE